jgi:deoxyribonuclease-4
MDAFENCVGFSYLKGMHINDSKVALGSRVDRHQSIGKGEMGLDAFSFVMKDPRIDEIPMILETIDEDLWPEEIAMLKRMTSS